MFYIKVYVEYASDLGYNDYDEQVVKSWDECLKYCRKFMEGAEDGVNADIGIEIFDDEGKKFMDLEFNDFEHRVFEYNKVSYGYGRHEFVKEEK